MLRFGEETQNKTRATGAIKRTQIRELHSCGLIESFTDCLTEPMRPTYHRWPQHLRKSLTSFIRTRILSQSLIQMAWTEVKFVTLSPQVLLQLEENPQTTKTWKQNLLWPGTVVPTGHKCAPFHFFWVEQWLVSDCSHLPGHTWIFTVFVIQLYPQTSGSPCFDPDLKQH